MATDLDMTQYLDLFLQEAEEQLEILEHETIQLEREPSPERLNAIFRSAHTLKGSSRAMGFANFADLTHEMENLLDSLRAGRLVVTTAIADALLRCLDELGEMKQSISTSGSDQHDTRSLMAELRSLQADEIVVNAAPVETDLPSEIRDALRLAQEHGAVYHAKFKLRADCVLKFARVYMAIEVVQREGELLVAMPDLEALEEERFESHFELIFSSARAIEDVRTDLGRIGEMDSYTLEPWVEATEAAPQAPVKQVHEVEATAQTEAGGAALNRREGSHTVRVDVGRLDELMNLVGELVIDRTRISQIGAALAAKYDLDENVEALAETVGHISRITFDLQDILLKARMLPIETVFNRLPRAMRDLLHKVGKEVRLELEGGETELDRSVIEVLGDPLLHIMRNSVDHGIETPEERIRLGKPREGLVRVSARHQENHIVIEISDDGKGIDTARVRAKAVERGLLSHDAAERLGEKESLQLIFNSGLSTATEITDVSGRGVGMDIVRSNIQRLGGLIDVESTPGKGSLFTLRLPLTLAIIRGLLVKVGTVVFVLPLTSVIETLKVEEEDVKTVGGQEVILLRGATTPLLHLGQLFESFEETETTSKSRYVVVVGLAEHRIGIVVDGLVGEQEVVIKSLSRFCGDVRGISGATILGNGRVALIVDVNGVIQLAKGNEGQ